MRRFVPPSDSYCVAAVYSKVMYFRRVKFMIYIKVVFSLVLLLSFNLTANANSDEFHLGIVKIVEENTKVAIEQNLNFVKGKLDLSRESLKDIEFVLDDASFFVEDLSEEQKVNLVDIYASYILNVAYKEYGGRFTILKLNDESVPVLIVGEPEYSIAILAHDKVEGRMNGDKADNIPFFYQGLVEHVRDAKKGEKLIVK